MLDAPSLSKCRHQLLVLFVAVAVAACSSQAVGGPEAIMKSGSDVRAVPWPSDALLGADGKLHVVTPLPFDANVQDDLVQLAATLSSADGFATTRSIFFPVSDDVTLDAGATATVIDLDDASKRLAYPLFYRHDTKQLVAMAPLGTALLEHHAYGCYVAAGVHDAAGHALHPSSVMSDAIAGRGDVGARASYQKLARALEAAKVKPLAATAFTTQTLSVWAHKAQADLAAMPPKATVDKTFATPAELDAVFGGAATTTKPGIPPSGGVLHDAVAAVVVGHFDSPHYLSATPGTLGLFDDAMSVKATDHIPYLLVLPTRASYAATPLIIFQHGINGDRSEVLMVANSYAARGYATLGIDELWHGSRTPGSVDKVFNLSGAPGQDGIGDPSEDALRYFFDFAGDSAHGVLPVDPRYIRDNFRQATIDLMQEVRLARGGDFSDVIAALPALKGLSLDGSKVVYTAASFGSVMGAALLAVDPMLEAAVLDTGGSGLLIDLVPNSPQLAPLLPPFVSAAFDGNVAIGQPGQPPTSAQMSLNVLQEVIEPSDGLALAPSADPSKSALFLFAYGDEIVPNQANQALARGWGATELELGGGSRPLGFVSLPTANAPYQASSLRAAVQLDPAGHAMFVRQNGRHEYMAPFPPFVAYPQPVPVVMPIVQAHALALSFIDSFRMGAPSVADVPAGP